MTNQQVAMVLCIGCFVLGGIGLYFGIPHSGWAIFIAVCAGISAVG